MQELVEARRQKARLQTATDVAALQQALRETQLVILSQKEAMEALQGRYSAMEGLASLQVRQQLHPTETNQRTMTQDEEAANALWARKAVKLQENANGTAVEAAGGTATSSTPLA